MWYHERIGAQEWFYASPAGAKEENCGGFETVNLPGGLFAVTSCINADSDQAADWLNTREERIQWAEKSEQFKVYENGEGKTERSPMFHIVSPGALYQEHLSINKRAPESSDARCFFMFGFFSCRFRYTYSAFSYWKPRVLKA